MKRVIYLEEPQAYLKNITLDIKEYPDYIISITDDKKSALAFDNNDFVTYDILIRILGIIKSINFKVETLS